MSYEHLLRINKKDEQIETLQDWTLIASDTGAWGGERGDWSTHLQSIQQWVKDWSVAVQAGGNMGVYPYMLSRMFKTVYTFEPDSINFHCLVHNCQVDNVIKINSALGAEHRLVGVKRNNMQNVGTHTVSLEGDNVFTPQLMLDDFDLASCGLLWLDVEGYEMQIILGARRVISAYKPIIMAENGHANPAILQALSEVGYRVVDQSASDTIYAVV